ncbi:hypothetical protein [Metabacillus litoralis]|uniref:hypothetical protein n=1 Tax=Metabacillus litoralis TaxID=152268 RepID=UPI00203DB434|nr:hypothetical protein [Metabacillus litoralis]MCM3160863.1 hypothetical protein [Metabacillus litoralis]
MSGYKENRDRKRVPRRVPVPIQGESRQKTSTEKIFCPDTRRIWTENKYREEFLSRYKENRDIKHVPRRSSVSIQSQSKSRQEPGTAAGSPTS